MISRKDLTNWNKDWENKKISSDAYICFLTAYIEDNELELKAKDEEIESLSINNEFLHGQIEAHIDIENYIEKVANRTCESCKYFRPTEVCMNKDCMLFDNIVESGFGCNKWESKIND